MALYMLMGKYSAQAVKAIFEGGSNREDAARAAVEAAGGKLLGFYGMFGQEYNVAIIVETANNASYLGTVAPVIMSGTFVDVKTIPLFTASEVQEASKIAKKVGKSYKPPKG